MELIRKDAVIDALYDWADHSMTNDEAWHLRQVVGDIKSMKSYTVEVKNGNPVEGIIENEFEGMDQEEAKAFDFGSRLRRLLDEKGMSQRDLAKMARVTNVSICRYISNERTPRGPIVAQIAKVLDVSTDYLLGLSDTY